MKKLLLFGIVCLSTAKIFAQGCTVTASVTRDTIVCGQAVTLSAFGQAQGTPFLTENFNSGSFGPGWAATTQAMWNNPCSPGGADGTTHIWLGNSSPVPRALTTATFNLNSCANAGVTICFDMLFATQGNAAPCEGPDLPAEGVYIQYSTDGGATWNNIHYFDPNGGTDPQFTNWNNWCFPVPAAALTAGTRFRWYQDNDSGADFDHWGIDNVAIFCNDSTYNIVWQHDGYNSGVAGGANPTPVRPRTDSTYVVVMSNGTTTCVDSIHIVVRNPQLIVDAGPDTTICEGTCAQLNATGKVLVSPAKVITYSNAELTPITSFFGSVTSIPLNVTGLNMQNILPGSITSVCITNIQFFGVSILGQVDVGDLVVTLTCPSGQTITLIPANITTGTNSAGYANTCFIPVGGGSINTGTAPYSGNWAPQDPLNNLAGCTGNGVWTMSVKMNSALGFGFGTFFGWDITFDDPEISNPGSFVWNPTTNMTGSNTLSPTVCPPTNTKYVLTLQDSAACVIMSDSVNVNTQFCCNVGVSASIVQPACAASTGSINLTVTPAGNYAFVWDDSTKTQNRTNLAAGLYHVTITDTVNGCVKDTTIAVSNNSNLSVAFSNLINPTCVLNNGSVTVTLGGGTAPYNVTIDTGGTPITLIVPIAGSLPIPQLRPGTITISVYDDDSCFVANSVTLAQPTNCCVFTTGAVLVQPGCAVSNGSIALTVTNGSGNYSYNWSGGLGNNSSVSNLGPGTYTVTITDNTFANCSKDTSFTLSNNSNFSVALSNPVNPTCAGHDGSIVFTVSGGTAPYTITVDTGGAQPISVTVSVLTGTITGLPAGSYVANATDASQCQATSNTLNLTTPANCCTFTISAVITRPGCGLTNGSVVVAPLPQTGNYTYNWAGGLGSTNTVSNLSAGTYTVTVNNTDFPNCLKDTTFVVNSNSNLSLSLTNPVTPSCGGGNNGQITIVFSGGTTPYSLDIDTDGTVHTITRTSAGSVTLNGLSAGTVNVKITDAVGCEASAAHTFTAAPSVSVNMNYTGLICFGTNTGSATAVVTGGTPAFTYKWSNDSATASIGGLPWGYVAVTVTDANGCSASVSRIINTTNQLNFQRNAFPYPCQDPPYGDVFIYPQYVAGNSKPPAAANVVVQGFGADSVTAIGTDTVASFLNVPPGTYTFTVTDSFGCSVSNSFIIEANTGNDQFTLSIDSTSCNGDNFNDGSITVIPASMANAPYTYSINGGAGQPDSVFTNLAAGAYDVVVVNKHGCSVSIPAVVEEPAPVSVSATPDTITTSPGVDIADIVVTATNFVNPVFEWTPAGGLSCQCATPIANVDSNTTYTVTVSDSLNRNCAASDVVVILINGEVKMPNAFTPNGDGHNDFFGPKMSSVSVIKEFRIYNRWGAMIHNSNQPWDGRFNGREQAPGTYLYYIVTDSPDPKKAGTMKSAPDQGSFTLLR